MKTQVRIEHSTSSNSLSRYMVDVFVGGKWRPDQFFRHDEREKAINYAMDLSNCNYAGDAVIASFGESE